MTRANGRALACGVVGLFTMTGCHRGNTAEAEPAAVAVHVRCVPASLATMHDTRTLRGVVAVAPERDAIVAPQIAGRLVRVLVREGDTVPAGAVIAEVESSTMQDAATQARAQLAVAEATGHNAVLTLDRTRRLFERGIAARQEVDDQTARLAETRANIAAARAGVDVAARNVARATLRAPLGGLVIRVMRHAGELVDGTPATPVVEVGDPNALEFLASAPASDLVALQIGQEGTADLAGLSGHPIPARVVRVARAIDPASGVGPVRLAITPNSVVPPVGLAGTITIEVAAHSAAVTVPVGSIRGGESENAELVVCDAGHARVRQIHVGLRTPQQVEILDGLHEGELVVVDHVIGIEDGAAIQVSR